LVFFQRKTFKNEAVIQTAELTTA